MRRGSGTRHVRTSARALALAGAGLLATAGLLAGQSAPAWAAPARATGSRAHLTLVARPGPGHVTDVVLAASFSAAGAGQGARPGDRGVEVQFAVHVPEFSGSPLLAVGTATTSAAGVATLTYRPTWAGRQDFVASALGPGGTVLASSGTSIAVTSAARSDALPAESVRPDGVIGRAAAGTLLAILVCLWIVLVGVVVRVHLAGHQVKKEVARHP